MLWLGAIIGSEMETESLDRPDRRIECLTTVLAILLFSPILVLGPLASRIVDFAAEAGVILPSLSRMTGSHPGVTMIAALFLMGCTILFAWCGRRAALLAAVSLLFQGIVVLMMVTIALLPWLRLAQEMVP
jgi:hypothetical protein